MFSSALRTEKFLPALSMRRAKSHLQGWLKPKISANFNFFFGQFGKCSYLCSRKERYSLKKATPPCFHHRATVQKERLPFFYCAVMQYCTRSPLILAPIISFVVLPLYWPCIQRQRNGTPCRKIIPLHMCRLGHRTPNQNCKISPHGAS